MGVFPVTSYFRTLLMTNLSASHLCWALDRCSRVFMPISGVDSLTAICFPEILPPAIPEPSNSNKCQVCLNNKVQVLSTWFTKLPDPWIEYSRISVLMGCSDWCTFGPHMPLSVPHTRVRKPEGSSRRARGLDLRCVLRSSLHEQGCMGKCFGSWLFPLHKIDHRNRGLDSQNPTECFLPVMDSIFPIRRQRIAHST